MSNKKGPQQPKPLGEKGYHSLDIYMIECNKGLGLRLAFYFSRCELPQIIFSLLSITPPFIPHILVSIVYFPKEEEWCGHYSATGRFALVL